VATTSATAAAATNVPSSERTTNPSGASGASAVRTTTFRSPKRSRSDSTTSGSVLIAVNVFRWASTPAISSVSDIPFSRPHATLVYRPSFAAERAETVGLGATVPDHHD